MYQSGNQSTNDRRDELKSRCCIQLENHRRTVKGPREHRNVTIKVLDGRDDRSRVMNTCRWLRFIIILGARCNAPVEANLVLDNSPGTYSRFALPRRVPRRGLRDN